MNEWGAASRNLAERFGVEMSQGVTMDREHSVPGRPEWLIFTGETGLLGDHPITSGVKPFAIDDEWYFNMRFVDGLRNVTPILRAVPPDNKRGTADARKYPGREEIVAWAYDGPNGGRGFGFTGGHNHRNWGDENFRRLVVNAILWTAKLEVPRDGAKVELSPEELNRNLDSK